MKVTIGNDRTLDFTLKAIALSHRVGMTIIKWKWCWIGGLLALLAFNHWFTLGINASSSLPDKAYLVHKKIQAGNLVRGDYVTFRWHGGGPYGAGLKFTKVVMGVPGDVITHQGRDVYINNQYVSTAKTHATTGQPLDLGPEGVIPDGYFYVHAPHQDSLDSRYAITGLIRDEAVVGKAYPIF